MINKVKKILLPIICFAIGVITGLFLFEGEAKNSVSMASKKTASHTDSLPKRPSSWSSHKILTTAVPSKNKSSRLKTITDNLQKGNIPADWEASIKEILKISAYASEREQALLNLFSLWADNNLDEALTRAGKLGPYAHNVKKEILSRLAAKDPEAALDYYQKNKDSLVAHNYLIGEIANNWSKKSPKKAWDWVVSLEPGTNLRALSSFFQGLESSAPLDMEQYINKAKSQFPFIPNDILERWVSQDPDAAMKWIVNTPDNAPYMEAAIYGLADKNRVMAEELLSVIPDNKKNLLISRVAGKIQTAEGPQAALTWTMEKIPASQMDELLFLPLNSWTSNQPDESKQWIQSLPNSPAKEKAITIYAENLSSTDFYDDAINLINGMQNEDNKEKAFQSALKNWNARNPDEFQNWISSSKNADQLESLIKQAKKQ